MHFPQIPIPACLLELVSFYYRSAAPIRLLGAVVSVVPPPPLVETLSTLIFNSFIFCNKDVILYNILDLIL